MQLEAIYHRIDSDYAYGLSKNKIVFKIRTKKNDVVKVKLYYFERFDERNTEHFSEMTKITSDFLFDYYEVIIDVDMKTGLRYYFELINDNEILYYGNYNFYEKPNPWFRTVFVLPSNCEDDLINQPQWVNGAIVYQIFVDRFNNGDRKNDPVGVARWGDETDLNNYYGGDILGILDKLSYIKNLGVNTIYLSPIFKANTYHKYDTVDYYEIDNCFGDKELFKKLVKEIHRLNMRLILDGVFNHTSIDFFAFRDITENGKDSKFSNWYYISEFPLDLVNPNYEYFMFFPHLPKLKISNPEVQKYIIEVAIYWIKEFDIDGWRLDAANEISHSFWKNFRRMIKAIKPDVVLIGEIFHEASAWLNGDQLDSVTNYMFKDAIISYVALKNIATSQFNNQIGFLRSIYKIPVYYGLWNLIDSHDTVRFLSFVKSDIRKHKLAVLLQFTLPGVPVVYYGDEIGLLGENDPDCRRCMIWQEENQDIELLKFYKSLIHLRNSHIEFQEGLYKTILIDDKKDVFGFRRYINGSYIDVYINNNTTVQCIELDYKNDIISLLDMAEYKSYNNKIKIKLEAESGIIIREQ